jgi:hypothetical protein
MPTLYAGLQPLPVATGSATPAPTSLRAGGPYPARALGQRKGRVDHRPALGTRLCSARWSEMVRNGQRCVNTSFAWRSSSGSSCLRPFAASRTFHNSRTFQYTSGATSGARDRIRPPPLLPHFLGDEPGEEPHPAKSLTPSDSRRERISPARSVTCRGSPARRATWTP